MKSHLYISPCNIFGIRIIHIIDVYTLIVEHHSSQYNNSNCSAVALSVWFGTRLKL